MSQTSDVRILLPTDSNVIADFARLRLAREISDEMDREMASWTARWRAESLAHYLPQGWSFGAFDDAGNLNGYILAQPLLFYRGLTQTLWVEDIAFDEIQTARALVEVVYKWARDKHLQCVLLEARSDLQFILHERTNVHRADLGLIEVRSAKF